MKIIKLFLILFMISQFFSCQKYYGFDVNDEVWSIDYFWESGLEGTYEISFYEGNNHSLNGTWLQNGKELSWSWNFTGSSGNPGTVTYEAEVSGKSMSGTCSNTFGDVGEFTGTFIEFVE